MVAKKIIILSVLLAFSSAFTSPLVTIRAIGPSALFSSEKENADQSKSSSSTTTATSSPVVRCPNCDLCDGSGRFVMKFRALYIQDETVSDYTLFFFLHQNLGWNRSFNSSMAHQGLSTMSQFYCPRR
jgi:hypothetical protein